MKFLTILYILFPAGDQVVFVAEFNGMVECGEAMVDYLDDEMLAAGYSYHCFDTGIISESPRPQSR